MINLLNHQICLMKTMKAALEAKEIEKEERKNGIQDKITEEEEWNQVDETVEENKSDEKDSNGNSDSSSDNN